MKDFTIDQIYWHVRNDSRGQEVGNEMLMAYRSLVRWLKSTNLLTEQGQRMEVKDFDFEMKVSDFTEEGHKLVRTAHPKWLQSLDRVPIGELTETKADKKVKSIWIKYYEKQKSD